MKRTTLLRAMLSASVVAGIGAPASALIDAGELRRLRELVEATYPSPGAPGFSVAVVSGGGIAYAQGFGVRDVDGKLPVTPDTPFGIGSLTKQFTAAAILLLARDKKLRLDDRVASFEPAIPNATALTLRQLLHQTSGLRNYPSLLEHAWPIEGRIATQRIIDILATDAPDFAPGSRYAYSNANYAVLSGVVEKVSGMPVGTFMARRIFEPLGMHRSGFGYDAAQRLAPAIPYLGTGTFVPQVRISADLFSGAGGVYASASDMARWDRALLQNRLLDAASRNQMFLPGTTGDGTPVSYGMGFVAGMMAGRRLVWHNGLAPGVGGYCYNAIFPDDGLAVVVLSNGYDFRPAPERLVAAIADAFFGAR